MSENTTKENGLPESVRSLIRKVHELTKRGVGGEAEVARRKLDMLLEKHGITLADVADDEAKTYEFKFNGKHDEGLVVQCYASINPKEKGIYEFTLRGRKCRNIMGLKLTPSEYIDYCGLLAYYREIFAKELDRFYMAFIHKHNLFSNEGREGGNSEMNKEEVMAMMQMMNGLREGSYQKPALQIEGNGGRCGTID